MGIGSMGITTKREKNQKSIFISIITAVSIFSQLPIVYQSSILSNFVTIVWLIFAFYSLLINDCKIYLSFTLLLPFLFNVFCLFLSLTGGNYLTANLFRPINLCAFIFEVGLIFGNVADEDSILSFVKTFIVSSTIVGIIIFLQYFMGRAIVTNGYNYNGKNSFACILLVSLILMLTFRIQLFKSGRSVILLLFLIAFYIYFLFIMKSRLTLLILLLFMVYYIFMGNLKFFWKFISLAIMILLIFIVVGNEKLYDTIINTIILNNKDVNDINAITSNRLDQFELFKELFPDVWAFGNGGYYLESFPLACLLSFGIFGSIFIFGFALVPLFIGIKGLIKNKNDILALAILLVSLSLLINGLGEELTPYGPGVKCFVMWFLSGVYLNYSKKKRNYAVVRY